MKNFVIIDMISNKPIASVPARNGKAALNKFKTRLTSTGFYEIHKEGNEWVLSTSYGAYFKAVIATKESKVFMQTKEFMKGWL